MLGKVCCTAVQVLQVRLEGCTSGNILFGKGGMRVAMLGAAEVGQFRAPSQINVN
jgi:hypothetical protein